mmetsp:Transcript_55141/g.124133  ORF Transcript_55141/g.124133 Transcript_55141/m.124133 type:complete len:282 (-) Transcript_55141:998-1843(-)
MMAFSSTFSWLHLFASLFMTRNSLNVRNADRPALPSPWTLFKVTSTMEMTTTKPSKAVMGFVMYPLGPSAMSMMNISMTKMTRKLSSKASMASSMTAQPNTSVSEKRARHMLMTFPKMMRRMKFVNISFSERFQQHRTSLQSSHITGSRSTESSPVPESFSASSALLASASSSASSRNLSWTSSTTARATFTKKKFVKTTIVMKKMMANQGLKESSTMYIRSVHPSRVMHWKTSRNAPGKWSKWTKSVSGKSFLGSLPSHHGKFCFPPGKLGLNSWDTSNS